MKANEFVNAITLLKPSIHDFKGLNYPDSLVKQVLDEFQIVKISNQEFNDEILNLISNYDLTQLSINDITFDSNYQEGDNLYYIGYDTGPNRLILNKINRKISAIEPLSGDILFHCAKDGETFLDALYELMQFSKEKMLNDYSEDHIELRSAEVAYIAALKAGGEEFEDYYKAVLWI